MVHSDGCVFPDHAQAVHTALRGPKHLEWTEGTQIDFYISAGGVKSPGWLKIESLRGRLIGPDPGALRQVR